MSSQPKISVIIPVRNEAEKIEQCLKAVFNQTLKPYVVIVVDGLSTVRQWRRQILAVYIIFIRGIKLR